MMASSLELARRHHLQLLCRFHSLPNLLSFALPVACKMVLSTRIFLGCVNDELAHASKCFQLSPCIAVLCLLPQGQMRWIVAQKNRVRNGELYRFIADSRGAFVQVSRRATQGGGFVI